MDPMDGFEQFLRISTFEDKALSISETKVFQMMMRASANSVRMAAVASMPLMSGSPSSIRVTSGWCSRTFDRFASVGRLRHHQHARLGTDEQGIPFAHTRMIIDTQDTDRIVHNCPGE